jgi:hypothetical protein
VLNFWPSYIFDHLEVLTVIIGYWESSITRPENIVTGIYLTQLMRICSNSKGNLCGWLGHTYPLREQSYPIWCYICSVILSGWIAYIPTCWSFQAIGTWGHGYSAYNWQRNWNTLQGHEIRLSDSKDIVKIMY